MKPSITAITGGSPAGPGDIAADPRFGGAQSVHVTGSGFLNNLALFIVGPKGGQVVHWPQVQGVTDTSFDALALLPDAGPYSAVVANTDGTRSDWFDFQVK